MSTLLGMSEAEILELATKTQHRKIFLQDALSAILKICRDICGQDLANREKLDYLEYKVFILKEFGGFSFEVKDYGPRGGGWSEAKIWQGENLVCDVSWAGGFPNLEDSIRVSIFASHNWRSTLEETLANRNQIIAKILGAGDESTKQLVRQMILDEAQQLGFIPAVYPFHRASWQDLWGEGLEA